MGSMAGFRGGADLRKQNLPVLSNGEQMEAIVTQLKLEFSDLLSNSLWQLNSLRDGHQQCCWLAAHKASVQGHLKLCRGCLIHIVHLPKFPHLVRMSAQGLLWHAASTLVESSPVLDAQKYFLLANSES